DHAAGYRLQDTRDRHLDLGVDRLRAALDHRPRPVVEVADALAGILARLDHPHAQVLAGEQGRLHRVGQRVHVEYAYALQVGDAVQVQVVGEHGATVALRQRDQLRVHLG